MSFLLSIARIHSLKNLDEFMPLFETFFTFGFTCIFAVALLATVYRYVPALVALYRILLYQWKQPIPSKYALDNLKFCTVNDAEV